MSELLQRSAVELAALVRAGELTASRARAGVAGPHRGASIPQINAFTHVAAESALAAADAIGPERSAAPSPGCRSRSRTTARWPGCRSPWAATCSATMSPITTRSSFGDCARRGSSSWARRPCRRWGSCRRPSRGASAPRATRGIWTGRRAAPAAAPRPRSPPGWSRSPTATTAAGRSGSPRRAADWWGSSRPAGRVSVGPDAGQSFLVTDGVLTRTVADTRCRPRRAGGLRARRRDLGAPAARQLRRAGPGRPRSLRIALALNPPLDGRRAGPGQRGRRPRRGRRCWSRWATTWRR